MDIACGQPPARLTQNEFNKLDYRVMGLAFDLHNEMGNLWDEKDYRGELLLKCSTQGLSAFEEVPVSIAHNGFKKTYFIDLLINGGIYELKATSTIAENHEAQTLNYLFLTNTQHGKIINFRQDSLTWRFVSTTLNHGERLNYSIDTTRWNPTSGEGQTILAIIRDLLSDWGSYLSISLYREALCFLFGTPIDNEHQRFIPISTGTVLHVSGLSARRNNLRSNLLKYLKHSPFHELLWLNFNRNIIELTSLNHSA